MILSPSLSSYLSLPSPLQGTGIPEVIAEAHYFHWEFIGAKLDHIMEAA